MIKDDTQSNDFAIGTRAFLDESRTVSEISDATLELGYYWDVSNTQLFDVFTHLSVVV